MTIKMIHQPYQQQQGAGGIINDRARTLLIAVTDPCMYNVLSPRTKTIVDSIDAKDPISRTQDDVLALIEAIHEAVNC